MLDHVTLPVDDFERASAFYIAALAPLDIEPRVALENLLGFAGVEGVAFWLSRAADPAHGTHIAFRAGSRAAVDAFYAAALGAGGRDNGAPGVRAHYAPNYYAAYVVDPAGNNIEAVARGAQ
jgi:catechol 2,3-dioxygenase-like lactoylglutathione lyase family enzyme